VIQSKLTYDIISIYSNANDPQAQLVPSLYDSLLRKRERKRERKTKQKKQKLFHTCDHIRRTLKDVSLKKQIEFCTWQTEIERTVFLFFELPVMWKWEKGGVTGNKWWGDQYQDGEEIILKAKIYLESCRQVGTEWRYPNPFTTDTEHGTNQSIIVSSTVIIHLSITTQIYKTGGGEISILHVLVNLAVVHCVNCQLKMLQS